MFEILQGSLKTLYKRQKVLSFCVAAVAFVVLTVSFLAVYNIRVSQKLEDDLAYLRQIITERQATIIESRDELRTISYEQNMVDVFLRASSKQKRGFEASIVDLEGDISRVSGETSRVEIEIAKLESRNLDTQISKIQTEIEEIRKELEQCESKHC